MRRSISLIACVAAIGLSMAGAIAAQTQVSAQFGTPFALHVGQSAVFAGGGRITLTALTPQGTCPLAHTECVAVSPPQAEVDVEERGAKPEQLILLLPGSKSREQAAGKWTVRIVDVAPLPFNAEDVSRGRASATLLVTAVSTPRE